jgi:phage baseplate assembly protein W
MSQEFLGAGWKYPVQVDQEKKIALSHHEERIRESIWIVLDTAPGERLMRPDFGCGIYQYVFAPNTMRTAGLVRFQVEEALNRWEPRIDLQEVQVEPDPDEPTLLLINIEYKLKATDSRFNLVYPFYLQRGDTA